MVQHPFLASNYFYLISFTFRIASAIGLCYSPNKVCSLLHDSSFLLNVLNPNPSLCQGLLRQ